MSLYLLDTNIISFLVRQNPPTLVHRVRMVPIHSLAISTITEAELRFGLALLPREAKVIEATEKFLQRVEIKPWDSRCAKQYALMVARQQRMVKPLATADSMIAAHALAYDFVLVTNDAAFQQVEGLAVEDWTKGPQPA